MYNDNGITKRTKYTIDNPSTLDPDFTQSFFSPQKTSQRNGTQSPILSLREELQKDNVISNNSSGIDLTGVDSNQ